jgi:hypothetical protein
MPKGKSSAAAVASARLAYGLELARGCSHISSTLSAETENSAIVETLTQFCELYGDADLALFQKLLAEELRQRGKKEASLAVAQFLCLCRTR